jgi:hypothetical protein
MTFTDRANGWPQLKKLAMTLILAIGEAARLATGMPMTSGSTKWS